MIKRFIKRVLGEQSYLKLELFKKKLFPTEYDRARNVFLKQQHNFYSTFISKGDICFDVGANIGLKTEVFLKLGASVVALEPQEKCIVILKAKFGDKIHLLQKGAGPVNEVKHFYVSNNSALSSFNPEWVEEFNSSRFQNSEIESIEKIEVVTLDRLIATYGKPGFIKIDVEGFEAEVIKGLSQPFRFLSFEYTVPEKIDTAIQIINSLNEKYGGLKFNYSVADDAKLQSENWYDFESFLVKIATPEFLGSSAGDIYVKNDNMKR